MTLVTVQENLQRIRDQIAEIQSAEGLDQAVRIVAVTKGHGAWAVRLAAAAGLEDVGENRLQEAVSKQDEIGEEVAGLQWHLIGHLQTNKAKLVPGRFAVVHSVDSVRVANGLDAAMGQFAERESGATLRVLVQVNVAGEAQKSGCRPEEAEAVASRVGELTRLRLDGLMTMAPMTTDPGIQRRAFAELRGVRDRLQAGGLRVRELSMGMSSDFRAAVAEGATIVRLGTILLGPRTP